MKKRLIQSWQSKFYKSKAWKDVRQFVINRDNSKCWYCGKFILKRIEVHHKIELTEQNVGDWNISLNPENLVCMHSKCHTEHHDRLKRNLPKEIIVDDELNIDYSKRV